MLRVMYFENLHKSCPEMRAHAHSVRYTCTYMRVHMTRGRIMYAHAHTNFSICALYRHMLLCVLRVVLRVVLRITGKLACYAMPCLSRCCTVRVFWTVFVFLGSIMLRMDCVYCVRYTAVLYITAIVLCCSNAALSKLLLSHCYTFHLCCVSL